MVTQLRLPTSTSGSQDQDKVLASIVDKLTALLQQGDQQAIDKLIAEHPEHATTLRSLLPTLRILIELQTPEANSLSGQAVIPASAPPLGDFRLIREVGRGGMGVVYEAEQLSLSRRVAVKVLPFAAVLDPRRLQRFKNEALAAAHLDHPNIVEVYGVGCERCIHFYAMRFVEGQTLAAVIDGLSRSRLPSGTGNMNGSDIEPTSTRSRSPSGTYCETQVIAGLSTVHSRHPHDFFRHVAEIGIQAADALEHAHQMGIVHRDIKPSNLMLDTRGKLWITDFGLAHFESDHAVTLSGDLLGTLRYMSPEQADGGASVLDHRTDVYSLGITLYELLTLRPAFAAKESKVLLRQISDLEPVAPRKINRRIPPNLETIILKSMAKSPADRYRSAGELSADLRRYLAGEPIHARPIGRLRRTWQWYKRSPTVAGLLTAVLALALCVGVTGVLFGFREATHRHSAEASAKEAHWQQYLSDMHSAMAAWEDSNVGRTLELLERHRPKDGDPDLRSFEWHYLLRQCHETRPSVTINETSLVWDLSFSHDGRWLLTGNEEGLVRVWDVTNGWLKHEFKDQNGVYSVAVSPDDRHVASGDHYGTIHIRELDDPSTPRILTGQQGQRLGLVFSPDSNRLAGGGTDQTIRIWDVASGRELRVIRPRNQESNKTAPPILVPPWNDNRIWSFAWDGVLRTFDTETGVEHRSIERPELSKVRSMAIVSHDGRLAATAGHDGIIRLFETETGRDVGTLGAHGAAVRGLAFSPDDQSLASSDTQGKVIVWDIAQRAPRVVLRGHSGSVTRVAFSDDNQHLSTFGTDCKLLIWDVSRPPSASETVMGHPTIVTCVAFSPDGRLLASGGAEAPSNRVRLWETATGRLLHEFEGHTDRVWSVAFSPDGKELASTGIDGTLRIWDVSHGIPRMTIDSTKEKKTWVNYSRDGRELVSSEWGGTIRTWDRRTGAEIRAVQIGESGAWQPALSADGRYLLAGLDESLVLLEYPSLKTERRFPKSPGFGSVIAISPNGQMFASCDQEKNIVHLSSLDGVAIGELRHTAGVYSIDFSPDGRTLVTGDVSHEVHLWDVTRRERRATFRDHDAWIEMVRFSPDGRTIASASDDGTIRLWRSEPPQ